MHQMHKNGFWGPAILVLSLLTFLFAAAVSERAEARQNRGEGFITGYSLSDFHGVGHIDAIDEDRLVIDDSSRTLSSDVEYYKSGPIKIPRSAFTTGSRVGWVEGRNGEIKSLWLLPAAKKKK